MTAWPEPASAAPQYLFPTKPNACLPAARPEEGRRARPCRRGPRPPPWVTRFKVPQPAGKYRGRRPRPGDGAKGSGCRREAARGPRGAAPPEAGGGRAARGRGSLPAEPRGTQGGAGRAGGAGHPGARGPADPSLRRAHRLGPRRRGSPWRHTDVCRTQRNEQPEGGHGLSLH